MRRVIACLSSLLLLAGSGPVLAADYGGTSTASHRGVYRVPARDVVPAEQQTIPFSGVVPACESNDVLYRVKDGFRSKEADYWNSSLEILAFERVREIAYRPWGQDFVPRVFCSGYAQMSDGRLRRVDYAVGENLGTLGLNYGVTWCVDGVDRNFAYAPECRAARP